MVAVTVLCGFAPTGLTAYVYALLGVRDTSKLLHCSEHFTCESSLLGRQLGLAPGPMGQAFKRTLHTGRRGTGQAGRWRGEQWGKGGDAVAAQGLGGWRDVSDGWSRLERLKCAEPRANTKGLALWVATPGRQGERQALAVTTKPGRSSGCLVLSFALALGPLPA